MSFFSASFFMPRVALTHPMNLSYSTSSIILYLPVSSSAYAFTSSSVRLSISVP